MASVTTKEEQRRAGKVARTAGGYQELLRLGRERAVGGRFYLDDNGRYQVETVKERVVAAALRGEKGRAAQRKAQLAQSKKIRAILKANEKKAANTFVRIFGESLSARISSRTDKP